MSDQAAEHFSAQTAKPPVTSNGQSVTLSITLQPTGEVQFQMPLGNKILAYGLLEVARAQLDKLFLMQELQQAPPIPGKMDSLLRKLQRG